ncbi:prohibitin family protein [Terrabacter sp. MAHUQ-38]|uniref:prohibitin family protein n=1 Tax=unclassified Terrabacter TaxID=2630222 RepID=UPI00165EA3D8|nr:prohibitin family protein [Terrabacter sp. MAHUQ-38]MBC9821337.1 prohibitin family protein [Terrabacter sp. MAHUQ-38]
MFALVLSVLLVVAGLVLLRLKDHPKKLSRWAVVPFGIAVVLVAGASYFRLDAGEAAVTKTFGTVGDEAISATGIHLKAPWQDLITFDIRNQTISFDEDGGRVSTVTSDNATVAYDVTIRYSLNPGKLPEIIRQYPDQDTFIARAVLPGVSSVTRDAPTTFTAATVRQSRALLAQRITEGLEKRLGEVGVTVEQVDPRAITLDQNVQANYDKVQSSLANAEAAKADLQTALAKAEITKTEAQATSDADQIIRCGATSTQVKEVINGKEVTAVKVVPVTSDKCQNRLNEQVLMSKYIDMLREHGDSLIVVPQGTENLLQLPAVPGSPSKSQ